MEKISNRSKRNSGLLFGGSEEQNVSVLAHRDTVVAKCLIDCNRRSDLGGFSAPAPGDDSSFPHLLRLVPVQASACLKDLEFARIKRELIGYLPGTACGDRGSRHSRSLGGRSDRRHPQQSYRHTGGTPFAFCRAGQGDQQRHRCGGGRAERARSETSRIAATLVDLGSRTGDGPAQELHGGHECESVLLRSAKSLAARLERKHQRTAATILS